MNSIKVLTNCQAAGAHQVAGTVLTVPAGIDATEAEALVRIGRARYLGEAPAQPVADPLPVTEDAAPETSEPVVIETKPVASKPRKKSSHS